MRGSATFKLYSYELPTARRPLPADLSPLSPATPPNYLIKVSPAWCDDAETKFNPEILMMTSRGKTICFIDNANVFYGQQDSGWRIDWEKFIKHLEQDEPIWQTYFFASE